MKTLAKGANLTDAAIEAGYSSRNPGQSGSQALRQIRGRVPDLLERHGLGEEVLIEKYLKPLLEAQETVFFQKDGKVRQQVNVAALGIRHSALSSGSTMLDVYPGGGFVDASVGNDPNMIASANWNAVTCECARII